MSFNGSSIVEGKIVSSDPASHSARVQLNTSTRCIVMECSILMPHGSGSGDSHLLSMPVTGQQVIVLLDKKEQSGIILGTLPQASMGSEPSPMSLQFDPNANKIRNTNYRGEDFDDILPGDVSIRSKESRVHLSDNELLINSGEARIDLSSPLGGFSHIHSQANTITHKNSLFSYKVVDPGAGANATMELGAFTQDITKQTKLSDTSSNTTSPDTTIKMNSQTPLDVNYNGKAQVSIDSQGRLLLRGKSVTIDTDGLTHVFSKDADLDTIYNNSITLGSAQDVTFTSGGKLSAKGATTELSGDNSVSITSAQGSVAITSGGIPKYLARPGVDQTLVLNAPNGGIDIKAGGILPGPSSLTKPGVRIQSDGGGDIHISSVPSSGGAFTTGSIVIDSAVPASTAGSGGPGNYGIVLNSPLIHIGGIPGVADTPAGTPALYGPPVPPVYDGFVKHFPHVTTYNVALLASVSTALAAAFPPTASASVGGFVGGFSTALATMSLPTVGRPLTMVGIG